jgi:hypothetical protein
LDDVRQLDRARTPKGCVPPILIGSESYSIRYSFRLPHQEAWGDHR